MSINPFANVKNPFHPVTQARDYQRFEDAIQCAIVSFHRAISSEAMVRTMAEKLNTEDKLRALGKKLPGILKKEGRKA